MGKILYCAVCNIPGLVGKGLFPYYTPWSATKTTWAHQNCGQTLTNKDYTTKVELPTEISEGDSDDLFSAMKEYEKNVT
jgi:hypothetical protein